MTDERQTLDSNPSTATAEPPAEQPGSSEPQAAAGEPEAEAAAPQAQAAGGGEGEEGKPQAQAGEGKGTVQDAGGGEVAAEAGAEPAGGEGEPVAAGGEDESAATAGTGGGEGETVVAAAGGGEDQDAVAAEGTRDEGQSVAASGGGGKEVAEAEAAPAGDQEAVPQAATAEPAADTGAPAPAGEEGAPLAAVGEVAGDDEAPTAAAVAEPAAEEPAQEPAAEAPAAVQAAETAAPVAEAEPETAPATETTSPDAESPTHRPAAAAPAEAATPSVESSAAPATEATAAAEPTPAAEAPAAAAPSAGSPSAEAPAAATAAPAAAEPEEPEDPALAALRDAREKGTPVEGRVIGWNRGGFHVVVGAVTAFCPSSEMEVGRPKSPQSYVEKTFSFKVIKYQKKGRRVVLSRAAVLGEKRQQVVADLAPGKVATGRVTSLPDFGAFVDLGGVEGLVHVSEISRGRVQHPKDALQIGQEVEVKVLKVEQNGERISLSMKDLEPDPWQGAGQRFGRGDRFSGKVLRKTDFGLFVELEPDVEGLLHVSQLPPGKSMDDAEYQPGQPLEGWVREVEPKRQRISLTLREVPTDDPWKSVTQRFPEGESVEGTVESIAPFGVFITLAPGITGLLPNSQTGLPRGTNAARAFSPGQTVRVQVLSIDTRRKRISLGREGAHVEASKNDLQDFKRREREREREKPTAMAAAFARLREGREEREEQ